MVVADGADPRWERRDPSPDQAARLVQDPAGRLREWPQTGFVSLAFSGKVATPAGELRAGVASPTAKMVLAHGDAYDNPARDDVPAAFLVDVPLADDGRIALVYPDNGQTEPGWQVAPAGTADVVTLINGGYLATAQVIQFLAAPATEPQYEVFVRDAQAVADELGRDVYIVGAAGADVVHDQDRNTFAAMRKGPDGQVVVPWRLLRPGGAGEQAELPGYFETDQQGALVQVFAAGPVMTFADLVTFEPREAIDRHLGEYQRYEELGTGGLPLVVVPTRGGEAVGSGNARLRARSAAQAVAEMRLNERPLRLLFRPLDDVPPRRLLEDWIQAFAWKTGATVYGTREAQFNHHFHDFAALRWGRFVPKNPVVPMLRYVRNPITGLLVPEDLAANPLPMPQQGTGPAPGVLPRELVVKQTGRVLVLPGTEGDLPPAGLRQDQIPEGEVVIVAHSYGGQAPLGLLRRDGSAKGEQVPVPPEWMAEIVLTSRGYTRGARVIFLVAGLGQPSCTSSVPEHYPQQVADLLKAPVEAITSNSQNGGLSQDRAVFTPMSPVLRPRMNDAGRLRLTSLSPRVRDQARAVASAPDGSLVAAAPGTQVSNIRRDATIAEIHAHVALLTGADPALAGPYARLQGIDGDARSLVKQLRLPLAEGLATEDHDAVLEAGDAVAGFYASLLVGSPLAAGWVADVQIPGGVWIRPTGPAEHVATARARLTDLPQFPETGLIVVGMVGRPVPPLVWQTIERALARTSAPERATLRLRAIDTAPSARRLLAGLVTTEVVITREAPPYTDPSWRISSFHDEQVEGAAGRSRPLVTATRSGYFVPGSRTGEVAGGEDLVAARWFPGVGNAVVLHVHLDEAGNFLVGDSALTPSEFHEEVVRNLGQPPGEVLILVACQAARAPAGGEAAAAVLARLDGWRRRLRGGG